MNRTGKQILFTLALLALPILAHAAKIGDISETSWTEQAIDFFSFQQPIIRTALIGTLLIGFCCGILGSFLVVRKLSLLGDTLSHAVLPGVAMGFLWNASKDPWAIFVGATAAGILGVALVGWIKQTTHLKEDSAMGMVLAGFYGVSLITVVVILLFYKEFLVISFDIGFAQALGMPVKILHYALMALLTFAVVVSLQAVGVVLVSALLITPAAAAFLLTDRMHWMLVLAAVFGMLSGAIGAFVSYLSNNLPTGPFIVLGATSIFLLALLFGPRHGLLPKILRRRKQRKRIALENTLKAVFHLNENSQFTKRAFEAGKLATERNASLHETEAEIRNLVKAGMALRLDTANGTKMSGKAQFELTKPGWYRACEIVRNHRLWELYLTNAAQYQTDHVHDDAEDTEHHLGEDIVLRIEARLKNPIHDPHGKLIPNRDAIKP